MGEDPENEHRSVEGAGLAFAPQASFGSGTTGCPRDTSPGNTREPLTQIPISGAQKSECERESAKTLGRYGTGARFYVRYGS